MERVSRAAVPNVVDPGAGGGSGDADSAAHLSAGDGTLPVTLGGQDCWRPLRVELRAWLQRNAPSLAELYEGAVHLMFVTPAPGKVRLVAHAVREIRNRLPDVISGTKGSGSLQYKNRLDALARVWVRGGLSTDGTPPSMTFEGTGMPPDTPDIVIERRVFLEIAGLIRDHVATREKAGDAAVRLFEGIAPENRQLRESLRPVVQQWLSVTEWFVGRAHDSGQTDSECNADELRRKFELFETILAALVRGFFSTVKELDEILEDTNS